MHSNYVYVYLGAARKDGLESLEAVVELLPALALGDHVLQLVHRRQLGHRRRLLEVVLLVAVPHRRLHLDQDGHGFLEHLLPACRLRPPPRAEGRTYD